MKSTGVTPCVGVWIEIHRIAVSREGKNYSTGSRYVLLGNESQKYIHYAMPLRVMGYDYSTYKKQYDCNVQKYKTSDGIEEDEYLSRMKRRKQRYNIARSIKQRNQSL